VKCRSGKHEWTAEVDARRCCDPAWTRVIVPARDAHQLDPDGRNTAFANGHLVTFGWCPPGAIPEGASPDRIEATAKEQRP